MNVHITKGGIYTPRDYIDTPATRIEYIGVKDGELCFRLSFKDSGEQIISLTEFIFTRTYVKSKEKSISHFKPLDKENN